MTETRSASADEHAPREPAPIAATPHAPARPPADDDGFTASRHVYEPHRVGLPPLRPYLRELWRRRQFAFELARTDLRAQHFNTALGQLWLILNALLLGAIYFVLISIVTQGTRGIGFLAHLMLGLFAFRFVNGSVMHGSRSVVGGGRLILNTAFPRALLPLASVLTALMTFLPTIAVYAVLHTVADLPVGPHLLWTIPVVGTLTVFAAGVAMLFATAQVYFRDLTSFLPFFTRIWLYISPVLYYAEEVPERFEPLVKSNPLYPMLSSLSDVVNQGEAPQAGLLLWGLAWAVGTLVVGALVFMSREREFAVRL